jgi:hypothetical protein
MKSFDKQYWDENYSVPESMDGICNAKDHIKYLQSFFALEHIDISSIIDFGFGHGVLFKKMMKAFIPYKACGIEPSEYIFNKTIKKKLKPVESTKLELLNEDLLTWCRRADSKKLSFDLGICTSVFQYIETKDLKEIIEVLSRRVKYLYLTLPTDIELERQVDDIQFYDRYAKRRTQRQYLKLIKPHFAIVGSRILESRVWFDERTTHCTDLLFRI